MAYTEAQNRATQKYIKNNLEEVRIWVKKGEREKLKDAAATVGMSVTQYVIAAINDKAECMLLTPSEKGL